jgi:two-component system, sensor histidine kinase and response regulator
MPVPASYPPWWQKLIKTGTWPSMPYQERRRIVVTNIAGISAGCFSVAFLISNYLHHYFLLCWLDLLAMLAGFSVPVFHRYNQKILPPLLVSTVFSVCCTISTFFYHSNAEYFLLLFLGVNFIIWKENRIAMACGIFNALLFFVVKVNKLPPLATGIEDWNKNTVIVISLCLYLYFLHLFKRQTNAYQNQIEAQNKELEKLNASNSKIMSAVAHDIQSPIATVYTVLSMLSDEHLEREEFRQMSGQLLSQVNNLRNNIAALLEWSKNQFADPVTQKEFIDLAGCVEGIYEFLKPQFQAKSIGLDTSDLQEPKLLADKRQVEVILRNLLSNAVKFSFPDSVVYISSHQQGSSAIIRIRDTGKGIEPFVLARLFDPGTIHSGYGTNNERGNGIGLKLCREFALGNGGDLAIESTPGKGCTSVLTLPLAL